MTNRARPWGTLALTGASLTAFAANSLLCRLALEAGQIDPGSFNLLRFGSGALVLWALVAVRRGAGPPSWDWLAALWLCLYGVAFAVAYTILGTGTGALILFGAVQLSLFLAGLVGGVRPGLPAFAGLVLALAGLVWLVAPGLRAPPLGAAGLMALAGVAWGLYSLRGRAARDPVLANAVSFALAVPLSLLILPILPGGRWMTALGIGLAVLSGAVASALGYVAWYAALKGLEATQAAIAQLLVPVLAALGGVVLLGETLSSRLVLALLAVIGGVLLVLAPRDLWGPTDLPGSESAHCAITIGSKMEYREIRGRGLLPTKPWQSVGESEYRAHRGGRVGQRRAG